jgi:hypothetical protein
MRTRTAAKHALSFPFVPLRQVMFCHLAALGDWPDQLYVDRVHF